MEERAGCITYVFDGLVVATLLFAMVAIASVQYRTALFTLLFAGWIQLMRHAVIRVAARGRR